MILFSVILSIICGFCVAFQSPTNAALSGCIGNFEASTISFGGAVVLLSLAVAAFGDGNLLMAADAPAWQLLGGFYGAYCVLIITFAAPVLGIALTLTITMLGQIITGMMIDTFGWMNVVPSPVGGLRAAGALAVTAGIIIVYVGRRRQSAQSQGDASRRLLIACLTFFAGVAGALQAPTNTSLAVYTGTIEASLISFVGGFLVLLAATLIKSRGRMPAFRGAGIRPWMVIGGAYGAFVVIMIIITTPYIGVALVLAASMLGQLASAILIDSYGLLRAEKIKMNGARYIGVAVIALGVVLVTLARLHV